MLISRFFKIFFIILFNKSKEQEINYTINSSSIKVDYCDNEEGVILFHIEGKINPQPYCNMEFKIFLSEPIHSNAECIIYDDINNKVNCSLSSYDSTQKLLKINKQSIKLNNYRVYINLLDFQNNSININCSSLYINKKLFINNIIIIFICIIFHKF